MLKPSAFLEGFALITFVGEPFVITRRVTRDSGVTLLGNACANFQPCEFAEISRGGLLVKGSTRYEK